MTVHDCTVDSPPTVINFHGPSPDVKSNGKSTIDYHEVFEQAQRE